MFVLDTNVLSALMQETPLEEVRRWVDRQLLSRLFTCSVVVYELQFGIQNLSSGRKYEHLNDRLQHIILHDFRDRVLPFDEESALLAGKLRAERRQAGFNDSPLDIQIAAITITSSATLATRNIKDFEHLPIRLVNPWSS